VNAASISLWRDGGGATSTTVLDFFRRTAATPEDYGAIGDGIANDTTALANLLAANKLVWLGAGKTYLVDAGYSTPQPGSIIANAGSWIKASADCGVIFNLEDKDDVTFDGVWMDGSARYPTDTASPTSSVLSTIAIRVRDGSSRLKVRNCRFNKISGSSIEVYLGSSDDIKIEDNEFIDGYYTGKCMAFYVASSVKVIENKIIGGGPQAHRDPLDLFYISSRDAIHLDEVDTFCVERNTIDSVAGIGIRIEQSTNGAVNANVVSDTGQDGIAIYNDSHHLSIVGNVVSGWGRIPAVSAVFEYSNGKYYVPRESPNASTAAFPSNPSLSAWWDEWPYSLDGVDTGSIVAYADKAYYNGTVGSLAFRGYSAISVTQLSHNVTVIGNTTKPDTTKVVGKFTHASDAGFTWRHPSNVPISPGSSVSPLAVVSGNIFRGRVTDIDLEAENDPINNNGTRTAVITSSGNNYRDYGPNVFNSLPDATIDNGGYAPTGVWTGAPRRLQKTVIGADAGYPRFRFTPTVIPIVAGDTYEVDGILRRVSGTGSIFVRLANTGSASNLSYDAVTGIISGAAVAGAALLLEIRVDGTSLQDLYLDYLSLRKVL